MIWNHPERSIIDGEYTTVALFSVIDDTRIRAGFETLGNPGWNWEVLAPYYKKFHTLNSPPADEAAHRHLHLDVIDNSVRGSDGPIKTSFPTDTDNPIPKAWIETFDSLGLKATSDPFSGENVGAYTNACTIDPDTRQRSFAASRYWKPVQDRPNLTVVTGARVQKLVILKEGWFSNYIIKNSTAFDNAQAKAEIVALHSLQAAD